MKIMGVANIHYEEQNKVELTNLQLKRLRDDLTDEFCSVLETVFARYGIYNCDEMYPVIVEDLTVE